MGEFPSVSILLSSIEKTWAEPKHLNKHNKVQYMTCYESLMSQIKKSVSILTNSDEFNRQL